MQHYAFQTNLGVKPLGRGQEPSAVILRELAIFEEYKAELNAANALKCQVLKGQAIRNALLNDLKRQGRQDKVLRVLELCASLNLPVG